MHNVLATMFKKMIFYWLLFNLKSLILLLSFPSVKTCKTSTQHGGKPRPYLDNSQSCCVFWRGAHDWKASCAGFHSYTSVGITVKDKQLGLISTAWHQQTDEEQTRHLQQQIKKTMIVSSVSPTVWAGSSKNDTRPIFVCFVWIINVYSWAFAYIALPPGVNTHLTYHRDCYYHYAPLCDRPIHSRWLVWEI